MTDAAWRIDKSDDDDDRGDDDKPAEEEGRGQMENAIKSIRISQNCRHR